MNNIGIHEETGLDSLENEYGEEVMYAGWNPFVTLPCQQQPASNGQPSATQAPTNAETELFLRKIYANQR